LQAGRKRNYLLVYGPKPYCVVGYEVVASSRPDGLEIKDCLWASSIWIVDFKLYPLNPKTHISNWIKKYWFNKIKSW
jgi:hypothetical protein